MPDFAINHKAIAPHFSWALKKTGAADAVPEVFKHLAWKLQKLRNPEATRNKIELALKEAAYQARSPVTREMIGNLQARLRDPQGKGKFKIFRRDLQSINRRMEAENAIAVEDCQAASSKQSQTKEHADVGRIDSVSAHWNLPRIQSDLAPALLMLKDLDQDPRHFLDADPNVVEARGKCAVAKHAYVVARNRMTGGLDKPQLENYRAHGEYQHCMDLRSKFDAADKQLSSVERKATWELQERKNEVFLHVMKLLGNSLLGARIAAGDSDEFSLLDPRHELIGRVAKSIEQLGGFSPDRARALAQMALHQAWPEIDSKYVTHDPDRGSTVSAFKFRGKKYRLQREITTGTAAKIGIYQSKDGTPLVLKIMKPNVGTTLESRNQELADETWKHSRARKAAGKAVIEPGGMRRLPDGQLVEVMDLAYGDLEDKIAEIHSKSDANPSQDKISKRLKFVKESMEATADIHRAGMAHGDLSPANIFVNWDGKSALADFGKAQPIDAPAADNPDLPHRYKDPAATLGLSTPNSGQEDLWRLGVTSFKLLTGSAPFDQNFSDEDQKEKQRYHGMSKQEQQDWLFRDARWVPAKAQEAIVGLLQTTPKARLSAQAALQMLKGEAPGVEAVSAREFDESLVDSSSEV